MVKKIIRFFPPVFFWIVFLFAVLKVPYPKTLIDASITQLGLFFIPLFLSLTFTLNIIFKNIFSSSSISFGIISLLILKALDFLNIVSAVLTTTVIMLLVSYFQNIKKRGLTNHSKIPTLTKLRRQN